MQPTLFDLWLFREMRNKKYLFQWGTMMINKNTQHPVFSCVSMLDCPCGTRGGVMRVTHHKSNFVVWRFVCEFLVIVSILCFLFLFFPRFTWLNMANYLWYIYIFHEMSTSCFFVFLTPLKLGTNFGYKCIYIHIYICI